MNVGVGVGVPIAVAMAIASGRAQQPTPRPHPADEAPHGAGSVVVLDPGLKELTHGGLLLGAAGGQQRQRAGGCERAMQSLLNKGLLLGVPGNP